MTNPNNDKELLSDLFFNEQDDDFLLNLVSTIDDFHKEDFDWFNNLHLNYTPSTGTTTETTVNDNTQLTNEIGTTLNIETSQAVVVDDKLTVISNTNELNLNDTTESLPPDLITQPTTISLPVITSPSSQLQPPQPPLPPTETTEWAKPTIIPENSAKKKLNIDKCFKCKEKMIKNLNKMNIKKNIKTIKSSSTSTTQASTATTSNSLVYNSASSVNLIDSKLTNEVNKKYLLSKRTRKRSKPIVITPSPSFINHQTIINPSPLSDDLTENIKKCELEPSNKKFAIENNNVNNDNNIFGNNKKNVDLHIEQFSQLDLHSSEEDSELYIRSFNRKFKKPINSPNFNVNSEFNQNEITKRTRYSSSDADTRINLTENNNNNNQQFNIILPPHQLQQPQQQQQEQQLANKSIEISHLPQNQQQRLKTVVDKSVTQTSRTSQKDIDKLIELLKESSSLSSSASSSSSFTCNSTTNTLPTVTTTSDTNNSSNESNDLIANKNTKRKKVVQNRTNKITTNINEEFTLNDLKSLDLNSDHDELSNLLVDTNSQMTTISTSSTSSRDDRQKLWSCLKSNINYTEIVTELGSIIANKMSFWDLVKLKLKYSKNKLMTTTDIINDYTLLYSNMSKLLEYVVHQHSSTQNWSDNSSRSRSSSRNFRKPTK